MEKKDKYKEIYKELKKYLKQEIKLDNMKKLEAEEAHDKGDVEFFWGSKIANSLALNKIKELEDGKV